MPLGLFGDKKKPQPSQPDKELRNVQMQIGHEIVTVDRKLAEGGFAIVYKVVNRRGRVFALKRQFINEDKRQFEACKRECQIVGSLGNHKNIVSYVASCLRPIGEEVYEYMLLTEYYSRSVLSLMNDRLMNSQCLNPSEIFAIFCDMCEAVSRLHHSQTPVIHRDLKVENILIDQHRDAINFVLCDFGSATTRVLSTSQYPHTVVEEEILKYTTLSYRAPEMIDLYCGKPIGTKSDIWALGVMLYKLCYFSLPFGESALAIQNGSFNFPAQPDYMPELKALIRYLLEPEIDRRPDIYQTSSIAFQIAGRRCPVPNLHNVPIPSIRELLILLENHEQRSSARSLGDENATSTVPSDVQKTTSVAPRLRPKGSVPNKFPLQPGVQQKWKTDSNVLSPTDPAYVTDMPQSSSNPDLAVTTTETTSVYPSYQPSLVKPHALHGSELARPQDLGFKDLEEPHPPNPFSDQSPFVPLEVASGPLVSLSPPTTQHEPLSNEVTVLDSQAPSYSDPILSVGHRGSTLPAGMSASEMEAVGASMGHRRNVSDTSAIFSGSATVVDINRKSAFKPYRSSHPEIDVCTNAAESSLQQLPVPDDGHAVSASTSPNYKEETDAPSSTKTKSVGDLSRRDTASLGAGETSTSGWNPFHYAPYGEGHQMDDLSFGASFDRLPRPRRVGSVSSTSNVKSSESLIMTIDEKDPFGAAPFNPFKKSSQQTLRSSPSPVEGKPTPTQSTEGISTYNCENGVKTESPPIEQTPIVTSITNSIKHNSNRYRKLIDTDDESAGPATSNSLYPPHRECEDSDSVGSASDLRQRMMALSTTDDSAAEQSDQEEKDKRFNYEHFDSDSRGSAERERHSAKLYESYSGEEDGKEERLEPSKETDADETGHKPLLDDDELELEPRELIASTHMTETNVKPEAVEMTVITSTSTTNTAPRASVDEDMVISPVLVDTPVTLTSAAVTPQAAQVPFGRIPGPLPRRPDEIFLNAPLRATPESTRKIPPKSVNEPLRLIVNDSPNIPHPPKLPPPIDAFGAIPLQSVVSPSAKMSHQTVIQTKMSPALTMRKTEIIQQNPTVSQRSSYEARSPSSDGDSDNESSGSKKRIKRKAHHHTKSRHTPTDSEETMVLADHQNQPQLQQFNPSGGKTKTKIRRGSSKSSGQSIVAASFVNSSFQAEDNDSSPSRQVIQQS